MTFYALITGKDNKALRYEQFMEIMVRDTKSVEGEKKEVKNFIVEIKKNV